MSTSRRPSSIPPTPILRQASPLSSAASTASAFSPYQSSILTLSPSPSPSSTLYESSSGDRMSSPNPTPVALPAPTVQSHTAHGAAFRPAEVPGSHVVQLLSRARAPLGSVAQSTTRPPASESPQSVANRSQPRSASSRDVASSTRPTVIPGSQNARPSGSTVPSVQPGRGLSQAASGSHRSAGQDPFISTNVVSPNGSLPGRSRHQTSPSHHSTSPTAVPIPPPSSQRASAPSLAHPVIPNAHRVPSTGSRHSHVGSASGLTPPLARQSERPPPASALGAPQSLDGTVHIISPAAMGSPSNNQTTLPRQIIRSAPSSARGSVRSHTSNNAAMPPPRQPAPLDARGLSHFEASYSAPAHSVHGPTRSHVSRSPGSVISSVTSAPQSVHGSTRPHVSRPAGSVNYSSSQRTFSTASTISNRSRTSTAPPAIPSDRSVSPYDSGYGESDHESLSPERIQQGQHPGTSGQHGRTAASRISARAAYVPPNPADPDEVEPFIPRSSSDPPAATEPPMQSARAHEPGIPPAANLNGSINGMPAPTGRSPRYMPSRVELPPPPAGSLPPDMPSRAPHPNNAVFPAYVPPFPDGPQTFPVFPGQTQNAQRPMPARQHTAVIPAPEPHPSAFWENTPAVIPASPFGPDPDLSSSSPGIPNVGPMPHNLHYQLQKYYNPRPEADDGWCSVPSMQWDIVQRPEDTARFLHDLSFYGTVEPDWNADAFQPNTPRVVQFTSSHPVMRFLFQHRPCILQSYDVITVGNVMQCMYHYLHEPLTANELEWLGGNPRNFAGLKNAMDARHRHTLNTEPSEGAMYLRSDVMGGHRRFYGMELTPRPNGSWKVCVDFIMGPVPKLW